MAKHNALDMTGEKFNRLTALERVGKTKNREWIWTWQCDCGNIIKQTASQVKSGKSKSCGCYQIDQTREANTTHGLKSTNLYHVWSSMKDRCNNPKHPAYKNYGGRGIFVYPLWNESFEEFYRDMFPSYQPGLTLDRINNDGHYTLLNCRWSTYKEQANNRRTPEKAPTKWEQLTEED